MTTQELNVVTVMAAMPSFDMSRSETFCEALIGRPVDSRPMPVLAQWEWDDVELQIMNDAERAGGGLATVVVADMAEATRGLRARGVEVEAAEGSVVAAVAC